MKLIEPILADAPAIAKLRRDLHAHPELCFHEESAPPTWSRQALTEWGIPVHRGLGNTGVVGIIHGRDGGAAAARWACAPTWTRCRCTEHNTFAHASKHPGKMHACGHDGHTAMLLAAAKHLAAHRDFAGTVYVIFQPAEEGGGGAREMIEDGLFTQFPMEAVFGMHNWPGMAAGQFGAQGRPHHGLQQRILHRGQGQGRPRRDAAPGHRPGGRRRRSWCRPSRPSSPATSGRSTRA